MNLCKYTYVARHFLLGIRFGGRLKLRGGAPFNFSAAEDRLDMITRVIAFFYSMSKLISAGVRTRGVGSREMGGTSPGTVGCTRARMKALIDRMVFS